MLVLLVQAGRARLIERPLSCSGDELPKKFAQVVSTVANRRLQVGASATERAHVEERIRLADGKADELNEGVVPERIGGAAAVGVGRCRVLPAGTNVRPQGAVLGAGIERHDATDSVVDVVGEIAGGHTWLTRLLLTCNHPDQTARSAKFEFMN